MFADALLPSPPAPVAAAFAEAPRRVLLAARDRVFEATAEDAEAWAVRHAAHLALTYHLRRRAR